MAEELIAEYRWRLPVDEWSPLCDNILKLDRSTGFSDGPLKKNKGGICPPPCEMCVTALVNGTCETEIEHFPSPDTIQPDRLKITFCEFIPAGQRFGFLFSGGGDEFAYISEESTGEELAEQIKTAMQDFVASQGPSGFWQNVTVSSSGRVLTVFYGVQSTGQLNLTITED